MALLDVLRPRNLPVRTPGINPAVYDDIGVQPMNINDVIARLEGGPVQPQQPQSLRDPKTLSGRVQEWLGAKEPVQNGVTENILSSRFQSDPSLSDASQGIVQTLSNGPRGNLITGQMVADDRVKNYIDRISSLSRAEYLSKGGGSGSVFAQTMDAINNDPQLANLPMMDKIRLAQNKLGTNLTIGAAGQVSDMGGAAQGLGNLAYGEEMGTQNARVQTARPLAVQKGIGEAETAGSIATNTAVGRAVGEAQGNNAKKAVNAPQVLMLTQQAKGILPYATSGGASALGAKGKGFFGYSDQATQADAQLDAISAGLLNNVPRMEGPQSDADRLSYEKAAGDVGNRSKPIGDRAAALEIIERLQQKYAGQDGQDLGSPEPRQAPDGNFYIDDPNRPGKYLMVQP